MNKYFQLKIHTYIHTWICLSIYLPIVHLSIYPSIYLSGFCGSIHDSTHFLSQGSPEIMNLWLINDTFLWVCCLRKTRLTQKSHKRKVCRNLIVAVQRKWCWLLCSNCYPLQYTICGKKTIRKKQQPWNHLPHERSIFFCWACGCFGDLMLGKKVDFKFKTDNWRVKLRTKPLKNLHVVIGNCEILQVVNYRWKYTDIVNCGNFSSYRNLEGWEAA